MWRQKQDKMKIRNKVEPCGNFNWKYFIFDHQIVILTFHISLHIFHGGWRQCKAKGTSFFYFSCYAGVKEIIVHSWSSSAFTAAVNHSLFVARQESRSEPQRKVSVTSVCFQTLGQFLLLLHKERVDAGHFLLTACQGSKASALIVLPLINSVFL